MYDLDRTGNIISKLICNERMKYKDIDSHKSYTRLDSDFDVDVRKIETVKFKKGIYQIKDINSYHSR